MSLVLARLLLDMKSVMLSAERKTLMILTRKLVLLGVFAIGFAGCGQKAEEPKVEQAQAPGSSADYAVYTKEINGLSQVGLETTTGKYPITTINKVTLDSAVAGIGQRIKIDPLVTGTEVSGQKKELLDALAVSATANIPQPSRITALNKPVIEQIKGDLMEMTDEQVINDKELTDAISAIKGESVWSKLKVEENSESVRTQLARMLE